MKKRNSQESGDSSPEGDKEYDEGGNFNSFGLKNSLL